MTKSYTFDPAVARRSGEYSHLLSAALMRGERTLTVFPAAPMRGERTLRILLAAPAIGERTLRILLASAVSG